MGDCSGKQSLTSSWWAVEQDSLWLGDTETLKDLWMLDWQLNDFLHLLDLLLKSSNLKTANGCLRTNYFEEGLFELRCRLNHACQGANNTSACTVSEYNELMAGKRVKEQKTGKLMLFRPMIPRHERECVILATMDIKKGQELTVNYVRGDKLTTAMRQEQLWEKYRFKCQCEACEKGKVV